MPWLVQQLQQFCWVNWFVYEWSWIARVFFRRPDFWERWICSPWGPDLPPTLLLWLLDGKKHFLFIWIFFYWGCGNIIFFVPYSTHAKTSVVSWMRDSLADPGKTRGCSTNNDVIHWLTDPFPLQGFTAPPRPSGWRYIFHLYNRPYCPVFFCTV